VPPLVQCWPSSLGTRTPPSCLHWASVAACEALSNISFHSQPGKPSDPPCTCSARSSPCPPLCSTERNLTRRVISSPLTPHHILTGWISTILAFSETPLVFEASTRLARGRGALRRTCRHHMEATLSSTMRSLRPVMCSFQFFSHRGGRDHGRICSPLAPAPSAPPSPILRFYHFILFESML
jgi:hypothetical protein